MDKWAHKYICIIAFIGYGLWASSVFTHNGIVSGLAGGALLGIALFSLTQWRS